MLTDLDGLRRMLQGQLRDMSLSSDEQERSLASARRMLQELAGGVQKQVASVEENGGVARADVAVLEASPRTSRSWPPLPRSHRRRSFENGRRQLRGLGQHGDFGQLRSPRALSSIEEMTFSIKEVAKNVEELSSTAEETSSSMNEMDISIHQVETNANETRACRKRLTRAPA